MTDVKELRNRLLDLWDRVDKLDLELEVLVDQVTVLCEGELS